MKMSTSAQRSRPNDPWATSIAELPNLDRSALLGLWRALLKSDPPKGISQKLMRYVLAYDLQARRYGDLSAKTKRRLGLGSTRSSSSLGGPCNSSPGVENTPPSPRKTAPGLKPGGRFIREWQGVTHIV